MPVHDWTRVDAGIFHHFHHAWIEEISRTLNAGLLPADYYALAQQFAGGFGPDVLTLQAPAAGPTATPTPRRRGRRRPGQAGRGSCSPRLVSSRPPRRTWSFTCASRAPSRYGT